MAAAIRNRADGNDVDRPPLQGILFDLGDTVLDFGPVDTLDLFEAGARLTYEYLHRLEQPLPHFGIYHKRQFRAIRWAYAKSRLTNREFNALELLGTLGEKMGHRLTPEQSEELAWLWYQPLYRQATLEPGLVDVLRRLRDRGLQLAIVSNTFIPGSALDRHLREVELLEFFPVRVYSCDVRYRKPHGRIFRHALDALGLRAEEVMFVGDSLPADIRGAHRQGMVAVLKDPTGRRRHRRIEPDYRIRSLAELPAIVDEYRRG